MTETADSRDGSEPVALRWQERLTALIDEFDVPGAALGILRVGVGVDGSDELVEVAGGVLSRSTGVPVTTDSVFHTGSITKVWTAAQVMQLVDEGLVDLDTPVQKYLPELALSSSEATSAVTLRHLLSHTSGIDGDLFPDTGRGGDAVQKYVALLSDVPVNCPAGSLFSYSNAGFVLAGRVVEVVTGKTWDVALREKLIAPLGLVRTGTLPEEAIRHRVAVGHDLGPDAAPVQAWAAPRGTGPCGIMDSTVGDLLSFARMHIARGVGPDGTRVLSEESVRAMQVPQIDLIDPRNQIDSWGIGWSLARWGDTAVISHAGNTHGQAAFLWVAPEAGFAVAILTNVVSAPELAQALAAEIFDDALGIEMPLRARPDAGAVAELSTDWLGRYERTSVRMTVASKSAGLVLRVLWTGETEQNDEEKEFPIVATGTDSFLAWSEDARTWIPGMFTDESSGRFLHFGLRATPGVESV